ncbi:serine hydrolase domain-containing protein [Geofilum rubicundum]|uniref:Serine-type D-Ala-D-Ala carboxypeptidase n=1 Tax=Geofilum rubicundum JCM 15548 TaxID=1236989 RepID=A0A0E9LVC6_9BACT|nr:serine hydrolase domain-containing protein [Geofilum rubicundum]GAO29522.1 serine-type D-Ala-D-Ala carboxypeptidase [Geofilum rubicundum JCM 15548]
MKLFLVFLMVIGLSGPIGFAQDVVWTPLDNYLDTLEAHNKFMGSIAVSKNGDVVYARSLGMADVELEKMADAHSKYRIGSISKTFTAVLVFKAVEKGLLDLDQSIDGFFPTIKNGDNTTVRHLLYHRSGIHNFTNDESFKNWHTEKKSQEELLAVITEAGSDFEPDSMMAYSNSNYVLLTFMLEKIFDKPYADLLTEHITQPLGLENTYLGGPIDPLNNECRSYVFHDRWEVSPESDMSIPLGAGGIVSTTSDLVKFSDALFGGRLLTDESLKQMTTVQDNFGAGLILVPFYQLRGFGHTGGIDAFSSVFSHFSEGNVSYALTSNGTTFNTNDISIAVLSTVYGKPFSLPEFKIFEVDAADLDQYLGVYASSEIPLKISITKDEKGLIAQATGQSAFPLVATEKHVFKFEMAGIEMTFNPSENSMLLKQGGAQFNFKRE